MRSEKTEQQKEVIRAISESPALAGVVARLLKEVGNDPAVLGTYSRPRLARALKTLPDPLSEAETSEVRKQNFIETYSVKVLGRLQISFILPEGKSRTDLIVGAQRLAYDLYDRKLAVNPDYLKEWLHDLDFAKPVAEATCVAVEGNVRGSKGLTRAEQEANGWNDVDLRDLVAAHSAFFAVTRQCLFDYQRVRAREGALGFYSGGLEGGPFLDEQEREPAASRLLPESTRGAR